MLISDLSSLFDIHIIVLYAYFARKLEIRHSTQFFYSTAVFLLCMKSYQKLFFIEIFKMHAFLSAALTLSLKNMKTIVFRGLSEVLGKNMKTMVFRGPPEVWGIFSSMLCIL